MAIRKFLVILLLSCGSASAGAQTTVVSATVVDSDSIVWANGPWTVLRTPYAPVHGTLDGSGVLSVTLPYSIFPYTIQICPDASTACGAYQFTTNTPTLDISAGVNGIITAPRFNPAPGIYGYADIEAIALINPGSMYWNVTMGCNRVYNGSSWSCVAAGVPTGMIAFIATGTCPSGWTEDTALDGNYILATTHAHGDVGTTGGSLSYTPTGTVSTPTFTGTPATLTGTVSTPTFTGTPATLTGSVTAPSFLGTTGYTHRQRYSTVFYRDCGYVDWYSRYSDIHWFIF